MGIRSWFIIVLLLLPAIAAGAIASVPGLPAGKDAENVPLFDISETIKNLGAESARLRAEMSKLPQLGGVLQMDSYGYHGGYLPVLAQIPQQPRWTLDVDFPEGVKIGKLIIVPAVDRRFDRTHSYGFPVRFRVSKFLPDGNTQIVREYMANDCPDSGRAPLTIDIPGEPAIKFRFEVFRGGIEGDKEVFALDEIFGVGRGEIQKASSVKASSEFESFPYWSTPFLIDQKTSLGLPVGVAEPGAKGVDGRDFTVVFDAAPIQPCVIELDLGQNRELGWVEIYPANPSEGVFIPGFGFPGLITVDLVREGEDGSRQPPERMLQKWDQGNPGQNPVKIAGAAANVRWVRVTMDKLQLHGGKPTFAMGEIILSDAGDFMKVQDVQLEGFPSPLEMDKRKLIDLHSAGLPVIPFLAWVGWIEERARLERQLDHVLSSQRVLEARWSAYWQRAGFVSAGVILIAALVILVSINLQRKRQSKELRQRITTDLHDDIGSWMSAIGLSTTHLRKLSADQKVQERCGRIEWIVGQMQSSFQDVLWFTNSDTDSLHQMVERIRNLAMQCVPEDLLRVECDPLESIPDRKLGIMYKRDLMLVFKEALGNAAKHSEATEIRVSIRWDKGVLHIAIADNGKGFDYDLERQRQRQRPHLGLNSMERRTKRLGGMLTIDSTLGKGSVCSFVTKP